MTNRIGIALAASVLIPVITMTTTAPANADRVPVNEGGDTALCVTYDEYQALHFGLTRGKVRRTFDTDGHRVPAAMLDQIVGDAPVAPGYEIDHPTRRMVRHYNVCVDSLNPNGGDVLVEYNLERQRVTAYSFS